MGAADAANVRYVVEALTPAGVIHRLPAVTWRAARFLGELLRVCGSMVEIYGVE